MRATRTLSKSGLELPELGLGCATLANDLTDEGVALARATLIAAKAAGITYFDTAPFYGVGQSERLVGDALRVGDFVVSSKVGRLLAPDAQITDHLPFTVDHDYTYDGIMRSHADSLQRQARAQIDILFAHDLGRATHGDAHDTHFRAFIEGGGYRAMAELRDGGVVQAIGLGVNETEVLLRALDHGDFDVFLLAGRHTLLERRGALPLFEACAAVGTDIIVGGPFNSGLLVGGETYNYRAVPDDIRVATKDLKDLCDSHGVEIGAAALQYPMRHPIVKSVIPGPKTPEELAQILEWADADIPVSFWQALGETE